MFVKLKLLLNIKSSIAIKFAALDSYINANGGESNAIKHASAAIVHIQAYYCHASLGSKIQIDSGSQLAILRGGNSIVASDNGITALNDITSQIITNTNADLVTYLVADSSGSRGTIGIAYMSSACNECNECKSSVNEYDPSVARFGFVSEIF